MQYSVLLINLNSFWKNFSWRPKMALISSVAFASSIEASNPSLKPFEKNPNGIIGFIEIYKFRTHITYKLGDTFIVNKYTYFKSMHSGYVSFFSFVWSNSFFNPVFMKIFLHFLSIGGVIPDLIELSSILDDFFPSLPFRFLWLFHTRKEMMAKPKPLKYLISWCSWAKSCSLKQ